MAQERLLELEPGHSPKGIGPGFTHVRFRAWTPIFPQVIEQADQCDHDDQLTES